MSKNKLRKKVRRLKRENLALIIECNAAMARAGEAAEGLRDLMAERAGFFAHVPDMDRLDG
jgi:hypothetical protein